MEQENNMVISEDLRPTTPEERNWGIYNFIALWIAMDIGIPTYYLASGLDVYKRQIYEIASA